MVFVQALVLENRRVTISATAAKQGMNFGLTHAVLFMTNPESNRRCSRWVSKDLNDQLKQNHVTLCRRYLQ
jgi:hypothetical protein